VIRDPRGRRKAMFALLFVAVLMVVAGSTFLQDLLNPREHAVRFVVYWLICAWLTVTSLLLALFDALMLRAQARAAARGLREQLSRDAKTRADSDEDRNDSSP
jgi:uncharacterized membrane protein